MNTQAPKRQVSEAEKKKSRWTLIAILVVSVLPVAGAYFAFFTGVGVPKNTVNSGELLPKPLSLESLVSQEMWQTINEDKKWRILIPISTPCTKTCEDILYTTRQVHVRLGEKASRVERIALNVSSSRGEEFLDSIQEEHPILKRDSADADTWGKWTDQSSYIQSELSEAFYLLVDQEGVAMMLYREQHGNDLLKDIKRALKYSIDYQ